LYNAKLRQLTKEEYNALFFLNKKEKEQNYVINFKIVMTGIIPKYTEALNLIFQPVTDSMFLQSLYGNWTVTVFICRYSFRETSPLKTRNTIF
jgi:hypothetical protein